MKTGHALTLGLFFLQTLANAQDATVFPPLQPPKEIRAVRASGPIRINGRLDEPAWNLAPAATGFFQIQPNQGLPLTNDTQVRVLFDERYVYIGAFCPDSLGRRAVRVPDLQRDFDYFSNDLFGLVLDPFLDQRNAQAFQTNPFGAQRDVLCFDDNLFDREWDGYWKVRTTRGDSGWVAEMHLPWKTLRYPLDTTGGQRVVWGINFVRITRRLNEQTFWSPVPRAYTVYRMPYAGRLTGLKPPPPSVNIRAQPYLLVDFNRNFRNGKSTGENNRLTAGGEVKWAINPQTVLDVTFNTDFAQADADRQVQNLTRFSVFFPERRQFFLENASLFLVGQPGSIQPFFSRRIGLSDAGTPLPIDAGLRLVSRTLKQSAGGLLIRQRGSGDLPVSTFAVGRYSRNIGPQNRLGGLVTARFDEATVGRSAQTNLTYSLDGFVRLGQNLSWNALVSASTTANRTGNGVSAVSQVTLSTNQWFGLYRHTFVSRDYTPGAGFIYGSNLLETTLGSYRIMRPRWKPPNLRQLDPGVFASLYHRATDGRLQQAECEIFPIYLIGMSGWRVYGIVVPTWQRLDEGFAPLGIGIRPGTYAYTRYRFNYASDQSRKLAFSLLHERGRYYDGRLSTSTASVRYSPLPQASFSLDYTRNVARGLGELGETRTAELLTPQVRLAVNPRLQLIGFYQKNTAVNRDVWNVRLAWEFQPLSFLYLVYNSNAHLAGIDRMRAEQAIGKLTYLKQF